jgi:hypothetical protein
LAENRPVVLLHPVPNIGSSAGGSAILSAAGGIGGGSSRSSNASVGSSTQVKWVQPSGEWVGIDSMAVLAVTSSLTSDEWAGFGSMAVLTVASRVEILCGSVNGTMLTAASSVVGMFTLLHNNMLVWFEGPRKPGEGVENEDQGIIAAEQNPSGWVGQIFCPEAATIRTYWRRRASLCQAFRQLVNGIKVQWVLWVHIILLLISSYNDIFHIVVHLRLFDESVPCYYHAMSRAVMLRLTLLAAGFVIGEILGFRVKCHRWDLWVKGLVSWVSSFQFPVWEYCRIMKKFTKGASSYSSLLLAMWISMRVAQASISWKIHIEEDLAGGWRGLLTYGISRSTGLHHC